MVTCVASPTSRRRSMRAGGGLRSDRVGLQMTESEKYKLGFRIEVFFKSKCPQITHSHQALIPLSMGSVSQWGLIAPQRGGRRERERRGDAIKHKSPIPCHIRAREVLSSSRNVLCLSNLCPQSTYLNNHNPYLLKYRSTPQIDIKINATHYNPRPAVGDVWVQLKCF